MPNVVFTDIYAEFITRLSFSSPQPVSNRIPRPETGRKYWVYSPLRTDRSQPWSWKKRSFHAKKIDFPERITHHLSHCRQQFAGDHQRNKLTPYETSITMPSSTSTRPIRTTSSPNRYWSYLVQVSAAAVTICAAATAFAVKPVIDSNT